jgi:multisubunit Na+/H+ antiporter MnhB subunit
MSATLAILYVVLAFMIIGAIVAVETRDLLSSVLCLGAVGFGLSVADLVLGAPDLALTQLVVEIFSVVLLIRTVVAREDTTKEFIRDTPHVAFMGAVIMAIVIGVYVCFQALTPFGDPPMIMGQTYMRAAEQAGAKNLVTAVVLDFRGYDTLGEATVIFAAIVGCYALLRTRGRTAQHEGHDAHS